MMIYSTDKSTADVGVIGLGKMGSNLARNLQDKGFSVAIYNRTWARVQNLLEEKGDPPFHGATSWSQLAKVLSRPRLCLLMLPAGDPTDVAIDALLSHIEPGDVVIDGSNNHWRDTERHYRFLEEKGISFLALGISGGPRGALHGPCLMGSGHPSAWHWTEYLWQSAAIEVGELPCCAFLGHGNAAHFVKIVHNGLEYVEMQFLAECYQLLGRETAQTLRQWMQTDLQSHLLEITISILEHRQDKTLLLEQLQEETQSLGTGSWAAIAALELAVPAPLLSLAVSIRHLSAKRDLRKQLAQKEIPLLPNCAELLAAAIRGARLVLYAQGFSLIQTADREFSWGLFINELLRVWQGGSIIRSALLEKVEEIYLDNPILPELAFSDYWQEEIEKTLPPWRLLIAEAAKRGIPLPALSSALTYVESVLSNRLPSSLIAAQRDAFGGHGFLRQGRDELEYSCWGIE